MKAGMRPPLPTSPGTSPDGLPPLRDVIRAHGLTAKKSLGQNFILDLNLTRRIARIAGPLDEVAVVEIGPGPGGLTRALILEGAALVIAIERDQRCLAALAEVGAHYEGRLQVVSGDALDIDWTSISALAEGREIRIVANLPYGIATPLLIGWLRSDPWPPWFARMTLMFQKEVAQRIVAEPGSSAYGRLSVIAQWRTEPALALTLSPHAFSPPPKVDSAVVDFRPRPTPMPACSVHALERVTGAAFGQRRKMLRTSLRAVCEDPEALLSGLGVAADRRGETLTVAEFAHIAAALDRAKLLRG
jgi:16S rRNA (adenine1518-N6/adenine1519-N6)-dimethyltransferase